MVWWCVLVCVSGVAASTLPPRRIDVSTAVGKTGKLSAMALVTTELDQCSALEIFGTYLWGVMQQAFKLASLYLCPFPFLLFCSYEYQLATYPTTLVLTAFYNIALVGQHSKTCLSLGSLFFFFSLSLKVVGLQQVPCAVVHVPPFVGHCRVYLSCAYIYIYIYKYLSLPSVSPLSLSLFFLLCRFSPIYFGTTLR
uniref:Secreted protein n=1 Tax=Amblyomma cajennense TaxID=34607 RepID=A0A023FED1_AMBCJ